MVKLAGYNSAANQIKEGKKPTNNPKTNRGQETIIATLNVRTLRTEEREEELDNAIKTNTIRHTRIK